MKKTIQLSDKYIPVIDWLESLYDKEEFGVFMGKLLSSYKTMKEKNMDFLILTELLSKYDLDIYKLIQILESSNTDALPVIKKELKPVSKEEIKDELKPSRPRSGILDLGINLSSEG